MTWLVTHANPCLPLSARSQASRCLCHPDHRCSTACCLLQQEPCCTAAAGAELQGKGPCLIPASPFSHQLCWGFLLKHSGQAGPWGPRGAPPGADLLVTCPGLDPSPHSLCTDVPLWQVVAEQIPMLVQGVRGSQSQPDSPSAQLALIAASQNFLQVLVMLRVSCTSSGVTAFLPCLALPGCCETCCTWAAKRCCAFITFSLLFPLPRQPGGKMVAAAKATVPTITDQASAMQLSQCAKNLAAALAELRTAAQKVRGRVLSCRRTLAVYNRGKHGDSPAAGHG